MLVQDGGVLEVPFLGEGLKPFDVVDGDSASNVVALAMVETSG